MELKLRNNSIFKNQCLINGKWFDSDKNQEIEVVNPFNSEVIAKVPKLSKKQVESAILAADKSFQTWKKTSAFEKAILMNKWLQLIKENIEDLATIMVLEQGKPMSEAKGEINYAASYIEFYAEEAKRIYGDILPSPFTNSRVFVLKQAVGVVGIITPWNFPVAMMIRKIAPAIACGCTCVVKPDERTPLSALATIALAEKAGIPRGVINVVLGEPSEIGDIFTKHVLIKKISFTGSSRVGKVLMAKCADTVKKVTLELGGNAPFIVFDDANIDDAVEGLIVSKFRNGGQTCVCANRVFVHMKVADEFINKLAKKVKEFKVGNGLDNVDIGPLINEDAFNKIERLVNNAITKGAEICVGGKPHQLGGTFYEPTILKNVDSSMDMFNEEIFGPIAAIITFKSVEEVIKLANNTRHGLASYFYAKDHSKIWKVAEELEYGMVGVNTGGISSAWIPFGGIKESGFGREGSKYGVEDYLNIKYVCVSD